MPGLITAAAVGCSGSQEPAKLRAAAIASAEGHSHGPRITIEQSKPALPSPFNALSFADGTVVLLETLSDPPETLRKDEPPRPHRPQTDEPSNLATVCHKWVDWAESHIQGLERGIVDAETKQAEDQKKAADDVAEEHSKYLQALVNNSVIEARKKESEKRTKEAEDKLAELKKREEDLKVAETRVKHDRAKSKNIQDLLDAVAAIGTKVEKANQDMRNLSARKSTPQSAIDKWTKQYCEPNIRVVDLGKQIRAERESYRKEHEESLKKAQGLENLLNQRARRQEQSLAVLTADRKKFETEQQAWRLQKGQELSGSELKSTMEVWLTEKVDQLRPAIETEASRRNWILQQREWDSHKKSMMEMARMKAYKEGHSKGKRGGYAEGLREETDEAYQRAYEDGRSDSVESHDIWQLRLSEQTYEAFYNGYDMAGGTYDPGWHSAYAKCERALRVENGQQTTEYERGYKMGKVAATHLIKDRHAREWNGGWIAGKAAVEVKGDTISEIVSKAESERIGFNKGHSKGYQEGHAVGKAEGLVEGKELGDTAGSSRGYGIGHAEGLAEGKRAAVLVEYMKGWKAGWTARQAGEDTRLKEEYDRGVERTERRMRDGLDEEYSAGKIEGYDEGFDDGWNAHAIPRRR
ncbi:uncharacterized protein J4E92_002511 [Alternaria infectoria]|uniref:uncharacterized protein n=1 Tax=Alternaria infectoria TaxID=45303 RepID=UPI00221FDE4B|nr:uncharacterized protein J4E92_002511 [Alternaria infectoria]KAI4935223.1 hypothetical protein J4E92_002511 [Alternaria infectoria]